MLLRNAYMLCPALIFLLIWLLFLIFGTFNIEGFWVSEIKEEETHTLLPDVACCQIRALFLQTSGVSHRYLDFRPSSNPLITEDTSEDELSLLKNWALLKKWFMDHSLEDSQLSSWKSYRREFCSILIEINWFANI